MKKGTPPDRVTLIGVDKQMITLSSPTEHRCEGVFLRSVPEGTWMFGAEHQLSYAVGVPGGQYRATSRKEAQFTLPIVVRGKNARKRVNEVLDALGDAGDMIKLVWRTGHLGYRWITGTVNAVSAPKWIIHPMYSYMCDFEVILTVPTPVWGRFETRYEYTAKDIVGGAITFPVDGTEPVWPKLTFTGGFTKIRVRLQESDPWQELPAHEDGWVLDTNPANRVLETGGGDTTYKGFIPYWPNPITPPRNTYSFLRPARLPIEVEGAAEDFRIKINFTPQVRRGM